jgi:sigma-B regulation protein RsbU (phosphoserine phosphatase)
MLDNGGPPLGLFSDSQYRSGRVCLQEGDVLVLYTDGVLDAANTEHDQFGEERLRKTVRASLSLSASEICRRVVDQMDAFSAGSPQWDDVTLAVVKVKSEVADFSTLEKKERKEHRN